MKVWINSFFIDYYDHWFDSRSDPEAIEWKRFGNMRPYKDEAFRLMQSAGINTPRFGTAKEFKQDFEPEKLVVKYWDTSGHATYGKDLVYLGWIKEDDMFVSEFIETDGPPTSTRILHVGELSYEFVMYSDHEWMSNTGTEIEMELVKIGGHERHFGYPLYAIDYVLDYALDLNLCPGLGHTPIEDVLTAKDCADTIKSWFEIYDAHGQEVL